jgi:hypothetical protein
LVAAESAGPLELLACLIHEKVQRNPGGSGGLSLYKVGSGYITSHYPVFFDPNIIFGQQREFLDVREAFQVFRMKPDFLPLFSIVGAVLVGMNQQSLQPGKLIDPDLVKRKVLRRFQKFKVPKIGT